MRPALALVLLLAGCGEPRTTLRARIDSSAPIVKLQVRVGIGGGTVGAAQSIPPNVPGDLLVILPDVATAVTLEVVGTTASGDFLSGMASTMSIPHEEVLVAITLGGAPGDGMMADASLPPDGAVADQTMQITDGAIPDLTMPAVDQAGKKFLQEPSTTQNNLNGVFGSGPNDIYAVGDSGAIVHSTGNGVWQGQNSNTGNILRTGIALAPDNLYVVGGSGYILQSKGDGTWVADNTPTGQDLIAIWAASPIDIYAVGGNGVVLHSFGGGVWNALPSPTIASLFAVWGASATDIWIGGDSGTIFHTTDHGMTWKDYSINSNNTDVNFLWGSGSGDIFGAMDVGNVTHWDGMGWSPIFQTQATLGLEGTWGSGMNDVYLAGDGVLHSSNDGKTWESVYPQGLQYFYAIWGSGPGDVYAVGKAGIIFHYK